MSVHLFPTHLDMHQRAITAYSFFNVATAIWATLFVLIAIVVAVAAGHGQRFLMWIAGRYEELQERLQIRVWELRSQGLGRTVHARLPSALAELKTGWEMFL